MRGYHAFFYWQESKIKPAKYTQKDRGEKQMRKNLIIVIILIGLLYYLSSLPGLRVLPVLKQINDLLASWNVSISNLAVNIAEKLPKQLDPVKTVTSDFLNYASRNPVIIEFLLRKAAHVFIFFVITIALFIFFRNYFQEPWKAILLSFFTGAVLAVLDEYHQLFVTGRHGTFLDVYIDLGGVIAAILLIIFSFWLTAFYRRERRYHYQYPER
jgi:VanZ family protein